jgi:hypothetical protein
MKRITITIDDARRGSGLLRGGGWTKASCRGIERIKKGFIVIGEAYEIFPRESNSVVLPAIPAKMRRIRTAPAGSVASKVRR